MIARLNKRLERNIPREWLAASCALCLLFGVVPVNAQADENEELGPVLGSNATGLSEAGRQELLTEALRLYDQAAATDDVDRSADLFLASAQRFESLIADGVHNGYLEYNLGNVYLQLGEIGRAVLHYRRAERSIPSDGLLRENLRVARSRCRTQLAAPPRSELVRKMLSWHDGTSLRSRAFFAAFGYAAFWTLLICRQFARHTGLTIAIVCVGAVTAAAGASAGWDAWTRAETPDGVVLSDDVIVRKGYRPGSDAQFQQPLHQGVEFRMMEHKADWLRIELPDGQGGWIPAADAELL